MNTSLQRIVTALILMPLACLGIYFGGWIFAIMVTLVGLICVLEWYGIVAHGNVYALRILGGLMAILVMLLPKLKIEFSYICWEEGLLGMGILTLLISLYRTKGRQTDNLSATFFGLFYPALFIQYIIRLREVHPDQNIGMWIVFTVFLGVVATDTFAYYTGKSLGKHPLFPRISPSKTYEGLVGGIVGCAIIVTALSLTVLQPLHLNPLQILFFCLICSIGAQLGDLVESMFKRAVSVKDSGGILPGHGGFLDRIDGMLFIAPMVYYFMKMVIGS